MTLQMQEPPIKIKSRNRPYYKIAFIALIVFALVAYWTAHRDFPQLLLAGVLTLVTVLESLSYTQTFLELDATHLKMQRRGFNATVNEDYVVEREKIESVYYKKKTYDGWELYKRPFLELLFPSGQSFLILYMNGGKSIEVLFDGNEKDLRELLAKLPQRLPNEF